jgi:uncharacterized protein YuzE
MKIIKNLVLGIMLLFLFSCNKNDNNSTTPTATQNLNVNFNKIKTFSFYWDDNPTVNYYKLLENADGNSGFNEVATGIIANNYDLEVPLYLRANAKYIVSSCNSNDICTDGVELSIVNNLVGSIGYFKASNTDSADHFTEISLSGNGNTLAIGSFNEDSIATGINGGQLDNSATDSGVVYIFDKIGNNWTQTAYVKPHNTGVNDNFGFRNSLSDDGTILVSSARYEDSYTTGINSPENNNGTNTGAVYVFEKINNNWTQTAFIKASNTDNEDQFGTTVKLSGKGNTIAVGSAGEDSSAIGINGNQADNSATDSGAVYIFDKIGNNWTQTAYIKPHNTDSEDLFGGSFNPDISLSDDGNILVVGAASEDSDTTGINSTENNNGTNTGAVYVFEKINNNWTQTAYIKASNSGNNDRFGDNVDISGNGKIIAIGSPEEDSSTIGIDSIENNNGTDTGAVYILTKNNNTWTQTAYIKASNTNDNNGFGNSVALDVDGTLLAIGAPGENSNTIGINGDETDNSQLDAGAVYVFKFNGAWHQQSYVKSIDTSGDDDLFGWYVEFSSDGNSMVVGSPVEDGNATGIGGDASDNSAIDAGAVYLY